VSVSLFDADLKETGTCDVTFTTDANDAETLTLTEDVPGTGVFHGSIATRLGVPEPNDGVLEVSDSDMITMMYRDAKGATRMYANRERLVEKTAVIDGRAPVISGVAVDASRPQPVITFETDEPALATIRCRPAGSPEPISQPPAGAIYAKRHSMVLYGLAAQTDYEFDIEASDGVGNVACDDNAGAFHAFTTIPDRGEIHVPADYPTIQEAIDHCWNGDTVLVADGTYTGPGNRDVEFKGKAITVRSENGPQSCILDCRGSEQDPHRGFYFHHRETEASVLDGFTVTGGYRQGDSSNGMVCRGGAILCNTSSPTIRNCVLRDSSAAYGGGLCVYGDSEVIIVGCVFTDNAATWGGGVFGNDGTILDLMDCTFTRNRADSYYGGFFCGYSNARATLTRCLFQENSATYGGGAVACGDSEVTIAQCRFVNNAVGGQSWCRGAGIMASNSEVVVVGSIFSGNKSDGYGAVFYNYTSRVSLTNCTFAGNAALDGRAVAFYGNAERTARLEATNCIVRDGGSEWFSEGDAPDIRIDYSNIEGGYPGQGNIDADPCFVNAGYWDRHEVRGAPTTEVWVDGDYHLLSQGGYWDPAAQTWIAAPVTSPCIDAGDPNDPVGSEPEPNGGRINMGAYGGTEEASRTPDPASG
jgi:predicted outer membrane repeat protein